MKRVIEIRNKKHSDVRVNIRATVDMDGFARYETQTLTDTLTDSLIAALRNLPYRRGFYPHELKVKG